MAVMMQGFYWDCATKEDKKSEWWTFLNREIPKLGKQGAGFDSIWLPLISKAADPNSMGYDPYDYFDLGDFDQKGSVKTMFGNEAELRTLISTIHENGMGAIADVVIHHNFAPAKFDRSFPLTRVGTASTLLSSNSFTTSELERLT